MTSIRSLIALTALSMLTAGCGPAKQTGPLITWEDCLRDLVDFDHLPRLEARDIRMVSSFDRTGGNNDFNNFAGPGSEAGWVTLVDAKGPGCIRRMWMTGMDPGHPLRVYIDGEKTPRIDTTIDAYFGQTEPGVPPLAQYVNMCYYSYVPITYQKSIRIETREANVHPFWGPRRLFFQIALETFPDGTRVESMPAAWSDAQRQAAREVAAAWDGMIQSHEVPMPDTAEATAVEPGAHATVFSAEGAGTITRWSIDVQPSEPAAWSRVDREYLLQDAVLRVYYDGQTAPSIEAPLGDFFGNAWRKRAYGSWWFTSGEKGYASRLPMPFAAGMRIEIANGADRAIAVRVQADVSPERDPAAGYLHAEYRRSGPEGGQPHGVTRINGRGKYLGCFLGVTGLDQSWWILEGDERMWVDANTQPVWHGTGLEDYFNGGWYYRGSVYGALNANYDRAPFRVAQFRHQHVDPVPFTTFFQMEFERMLDEQTRLPVKGWFQSVAYSYLNQPMPVLAVGADRSARRAVEHPHDRATLMLQLSELERANDFRGALHLVEEYLERYAGAEEEGVLRLRHLEYRRFLGDAIGDAELAPFLAGEHGEAAKAQAEQLAWMYAEPNRALVGLNANGRARLFLNNQLVLSGDHPYHWFVAGVELTNGVQHLAAQVDFQRGDPWLQAGIRTRDGVAGFGPGTMAARTVDAAWRTMPAQPPAWEAVGIRQIPRGVPDAPYIGGIPHAFILLASKTYPITGFDWQYYKGAYYFRQDFDAPVQKWPAYSRTMTGLIR